MKKAIQGAKRMSQRLATPFVAIVRATRGCFAKVCSGKLVCSLTSSETGRAAAAGAILFGIAGAGLGTSGGISAYGISKSAAGATVAVGWGPDWFLWAGVYAVAGAAIGAGLAFAGRALFRARGAAIAVMMVGALGGVFTGATWGRAVARERVVEVRAQPANSKPIPLGDGAKLSVVNGPVQLTGSVARDINGLMLAFMLGSGALVGVLTARGLTGPGRIDVPTAQPFDPRHAYNG